MKYIKPPRLSTSFSAGKHRARKRFENILKRGGKKTGIFALIAAVVITAAIGIVFVCERTEKAPPLSGERLYELAVSPVGSDMADLEYGNCSRKLITIAKEGNYEKDELHTVGGSGGINADTGSIGI